MMGSMMRHVPKIQRLNVLFFVSRTTVSIVNVNSFFSTILRSVANAPSSALVIAFQHATLSISTRNYYFRESSTDISCSRFFANLC